MIFSGRPPIAFAAKVELIFTSAMPRESFFSRLHMNTVEGG
jgi:hypothetical protein